jgi:hypothetical protein
MTVWNDSRRVLIAGLDGRGGEVEADVFEIFACETSPSSFWRSRPLERPGASQDAGVSSS